MLAMPTVIEVAKFVAAAIVTLGALSAAVGTLVKSPLGRPVRWLWRRNISEPIGGWAQDNVRTVVDERIDHLMHHNNSGSSLKDLADSQENLTKQVAMLLDHDRTRDVDGKRYGGDAA
jgi:hypothetical protein